MGDETSVSCRAAHEGRRWRTGKWERWAAVLFLLTACTPDGPNPGEPRTQELDNLGLAAVTVMSVGVFWAAYAANERTRSTFTEIALRESARRCKPSGGSRCDPATAAGRPSG